MGGMRASGAASSWVVGGRAPLRQPGRRRHPGAPRLPPRRRQGRRAQEPFRPHLSGRLRRPPLPAGPASVPLLPSRLISRRGFRQLNCVCAWNLAASSLEMKKLVYLLWLAFPSSRLVSSHLISSQAITCVLARSSSRTWRRSRLKKLASSTSTCSIARGCGTTCGCPTYRLSL
ncbi:uncharacterized protein LOC123395488 [Hordeum vulgare subsp. vulgare]|uniref:uncharacterized protein LOC123395488 n=1 Tax=Hordeum vulgare subsp. vulgare TaxID=112509 RepID=UPI001D1A532A|nr:uncharacterized protein LOC123395488 [Hordeum vulgare subsp. vulgare]